MSTVRASGGGASNRSRASAWSASGRIRNRFGNKVCSQECSTIHAKRVQAAWEIANAERRRAYYIDRYYANRDKKSEQCRVRYRERKNTPGWTEESRLRAKATRERNFLRRKVMREWGVDDAQARAWIEQGTFPP